MIENVSAVCLRCTTPLIPSAKYCYMCGYSVDTKSQTDKLATPSPLVATLSAIGSSSFPSRMVMKFGDVTVAAVTVRDIPEAGYIIGRSRGDNKVNLDLDTFCPPEQAQYASRRHAVINRTGLDGLTITDLGSANGTFKNGQQLGRNVPHVLYDNDKLSFGKVTVEVYSAP